MVPGGCYRASRDRPNDASVTAQHIEDKGKRAVEWLICELVNQRQLVMDSADAYTVSAWRQPNIR